MANPVFLDKLTIDVNDLPLTNVTSDLNAGLIYQTFAALGIVVSDHATKIDGALTAAEALLVELGLPTNWTGGLDDVVILPVPQLDLSAFPEMPLPGELPNYDAIVWGTNDTSLSTYSSDIYVTLLAKILYDINTGGTGIPTAIEDAIHERNLEKQRLANEKAYNLAVSGITSKALSFPQFAMDAIANQMEMEVLRQSHNSANEIDISMAELAQKNMNAALDRASTLEGVLRTFWKDYNSMKLAGVKAKTDELIAHVESITKEREGILKLHETEAVIFKATTEAQKNWYEAVTESQKAQLQKSALELQKIEVELKAKLDAYIAVNSLREKILATMGGVSAQVMASAMNAENVSLGASVSSSKNVSESYNHGESKAINQGQSIGESHDYNAKGADIT